MSLSLEDLLKLQESRKKQELDIYKNVYKKVESTISYHAKNGAIACYYTVPSYIFGLPLIDVPKTIEYILGVLNNKGFIAIKITYDTLYVSWETTSSLKTEKIENTNRSKNDIESLKNDRDQQLINTLVKNKLKNSINT